MPTTVFDWLLKEFPAAKRTTLRRMVESRRVRVNGKPARSMKQLVVDGDAVEIADRASSRSEKPIRVPFEIVHEDQDVLAVVKPSGLLTSTNHREKRPTLWAKIKEYLRAADSNAQPGLIHRLDRDASGLLVFSKNDAAYQSLKRQFFKHTVDRIYVAVVHGSPKPARGMIESRLVERIDGSVHTTRQHGKGQQAETEYELIEQTGKRAMLRVRLRTGRKHQIRVHLSERGWPIVGDITYGPTPPAAKRLMLAATELSFDHPRTRSRMELTVAVPPELLIASGQPV
jgi:RluA family pseudouridine synthase